MTVAAMHDAAAVPAWVLIAYLVAGICFILALRGLSSPSTSQRGNRAGMIGMAIAVATTLAVHEIGSLPEIAIAMGLGVAIGAITFSGSVIAFLKLNGNMSGAPILLPGRHVINLATLAAIVGLIAYFTFDQSPWVFWTLTGLAFAIGFLLIIPIGGADMPVVISMLNSYSGWAAAAMGFTLHNSAMIITG